jgi:hypothetical protein
MSPITAARPRRIRMKRATQGLVRWRLVRYVILIAGVLR